MLKKIKARITRKLVTVNFYMKSGNIIVADRVNSKVTVDVRGNEVTGIREWEQVNPANKLMLLSLDLSQIEAITTA